MKAVTLLFHDIYLRDPSESGFSGPGADRYKLSVKAFDEQVAAIARQNTSVMTVTEAVDRGTSDRSCLITVDDGGLSYYSLLADRLEQHGWRGHCLVTTGCLGRRGFLRPHHVRELCRRGHVIGSHSATHPAKFNSLAVKDQLEEWCKSREILEDITGKRIYVASVPGGYYSQQVAGTAQAAGLEILFTSEPDRHQHLVAGCRVIGRYTLRRDADPGLAGRLVRQDPAILMREWLVWNGKKILKSSLGSGYQWLSARLG